MILTEDEARTKWCPFVRYNSGEIAEEPGVNRHGQLKNPNYAGCIASECMAWRPWVDIHSMEPNPPEKGYCGLAR